MSTEALFRAIADLMKLHKDMLARRMRIRPPQLDGYGASIVAFLGTGDPQAQAINRAYRKGAGNAISNCAMKRFGVGFWRIDQRSVDFVAIVLGVPQ